MIADAYIWIGVWVVILIMFIISLMKIEDRIAEDRINKMFEYVKNKREEEVMPRYIDADLLKADYFALPSTSGTTVSTQYVSLFQILNAPTADVVKVVRCKDCKHYENGFCYNPNTYDDEKTRGNTIPSWFCADGERRDDEESTKRTD